MIMEKKYYIIPTIKVKEMEVENLMQDPTSFKVEENSTDPITDPDDILAKPMSNDFNVWEK